MTAGTSLARGARSSRVIVTLGSGHDVLQVAGHCLAHQDADRDFGLGGVDERIAEQIVQTAQVVADHHRQRFIARSDREERILVERIAQRGYEVVVGHAVQRHLFGLCDVEDVLLHGDRRDFLPGQRILYAVEHLLQLFRVGTVPVVERRRAVSTASRSAKIMSKTLPETPNEQRAAGAFSAR